MVKSEPRRKACLQKAGKEQLKQEDQDGGAVSAAGEKGLTVECSRRSGRSQRAVMGTALRTRWAAARVVQISASLLSSSILVRCE